MKMLARLSPRLMLTLPYIAQAVDRHVAGSAAVLEDQAALRTRFWLATSVHREPNNYAYYGAAMATSSASGAIQRTTPSCACAPVATARAPCSASTALPARCATG